jgi:tetratricopeptide (TPR) repeat protein
MQEIFKNKFILSYIPKLIVEKLLMMTIDQAEEFHQRALNFLERGYLEDALKWVNRSLEIFPENSKALTTKGQILSKSDRNEEASKYFNEASYYEKNKSLVKRRLKSIKNRQLKEKPKKKREVNISKVKKLNRVIYLQDPRNIFVALMMLPTCILIGGLQGMIVGIFAVKNRHVRERGLALICFSSFTFIGGLIMIIGFPLS